MKDLEEFIKLFELKVPVKDNFQYYIDTLVKSSYYAGLKDLITEYEKYESDVDFLGYRSVVSYKLDYALPKLVKHLSETDAFKKMMSKDFGDLKLRRKDHVGINDNKVLLSVDFTAANYNALKTYDSKGELHNSWEDLCWELSIHPFLVKSKSFRQYVFGNTKPKRLEKTQHENIIAIVDSLIKDFNWPEEKFVFISHDELIIRMDGDLADMTGKIIIFNNDIEKVMANLRISIPTHYKIFKNNIIEGGSNGMGVQTIYQIKGNALVEQYKKLFKMHKSKFYKYFKTHILGEELEIRDLTFINEGEIAVWSVEDDSIAERIIPEGELSLEEIERDHSYFLNKLKEVGGLSGPQKRKIMNIAMEICPHCHDAGSGCHCWNDE